MTTLIIKDNSSCTGFSIVEMHRGWHCISQDLNDSSKVVEASFELADCVLLIGQYHRCLRPIFSKIGQPYRVHETRIV